MAAGCDCLCVHMQKKPVSSTYRIHYTGLTHRHPTPAHAPRNHSQLPRHLRPFKQHTLDSTGSGSAGSKMSGWISEGFSAEGVSLRVWLRVHVVGFVWVEPHADSTRTGVAKPASSCSCISCERKSQLHAALNSPPRVHHEPAVAVL